MQALSVARSLKRMEHYVVLLCFQDAVASKSNFLDGCYNLDAGDHEYVFRHLSHVVCSERVYVVIPMEGDQTIFPSKEKPLLQHETGVKCAEMDWNVLSYVCDKTEFMSFCEQHAISPYGLVRKWMSDKPHNLCYFHTQDFDYNQPVADGLSLERRFKTYFGIRRASPKFCRLMKDMAPFYDIRTADLRCDWNVNTLDLCTL